MFTLKKQSLKKFVYTLLSLTSLSFCEESQARSWEKGTLDEEEGRPIFCPLSFPDAEGKGEQAERQYNVVGVALFSGKDPISYGIKKLTHNKVSHVGLILANAADERERFCFESTGTAHEVFHGHYPHVRLTDWETVRKSYSGRISYRLFVFEGERTPFQRVTDFVEDYTDKSYTKNPLKLVKALLGLNRQSKAHAPRTVFCSELVAKALMEWGFLDKQRAASNWLPRDFTSKKKITLAPGIELTEEFIEK